MSRVLFACVLILMAASSALAADLPPGALARLGDDRFRAGGEIEHLALSPDGKQVATATWISKGVQMLAVWDVATGRPVREYKVNRQLFKGFVWGEGGAFAVALRAEPATKDRRATVEPDDFRVWDFTKAAPTLLPQDTVGPGSPAWWVDADWPRDGPEYTLFRFSADGTRVAAVRTSAADKYTVHVFELKQADSAAKLNRVGTLDLGAEEIDEVRVSANGKSVVAFRKLANNDEMTAAVWNVATGKPAKPVRVPYAYHPLVTPDAGALVALTDDDLEWGFDRCDLATGAKRKLTRWKHDPDSDARPSDHGGTFTPSGRELVAVVFAEDRKTYVIDLATGKERGHLGGHEAVYGEGAGGMTAVSADGTRIATADAHGLLRVWDAKTLRALHDASGHRAPVEHAQLSPDGKCLLTWAQDRTIRLWDVATGKALRAFTGAQGDRLPVFTRDGTAVVYRNKKSLTARDLQTGLEVPLPDDAKELKPRDASLSTARLSAWVSRDGTEVHLFEAGTGGLRRVLKGHRGQVRVLGFTPDGTKLLTAGGDHTVLVWDVRLQSVPLPEAIKKETDAAKLWKALTTGKA
jgi:WD40 repeat protein